MPDAAQVYVVTPVHNGEEFLAECIESVLAQTYPHWQYTIVDNCSTDRTREIARHYAAGDSRIRLRRNAEFLDVVANWNRAMRLLPAHSRYCKVVHADDTLFPECLERMVAVAEEHPRVAIVGAYVLQDKRVVCDGLPYPRRMFGGAEVSRSRLRGETHVFGTPTTTLLRADVIRAREPFYDPTYLHADAAACLDILREHDWGYVHQVLTQTRLHRESLTTRRAYPLQSMAADNLRMLLEYGPAYFDAQELDAVLRVRLQHYYDALGRYFLRHADLRFIAYQRLRLAQTDVPFSVLRLVRAAVGRAAREPMLLWALLRGAFRRMRQAMQGPDATLRSAPDLTHPTG